MEVFGEDQDYVRDDVIVDNFITAAYITHKPLYPEPKLHKKNNFVKKKSKLLSTLRKSDPRPEKWENKLKTTQNIRGKNVRLHVKEKERDIFRRGETRFTHLMLFMGEHLTDENLFRLLFTMDLFQEAHVCFCDILNTGKVKEDSKKQLIAVITQ